MSGFGVFGDPQFWSDVKNNAKNLPAALAEYGSQAMGAAMAPSDRAVQWSAKASPGRFAEGKQDAARHTEWMADTSARLEDMARYGLTALPEGMANHLARGMGAVGAMGIGGGIELVGGINVLGKAGKEAMAGNLSRAGTTLNEGWDSAKMDLNNNMAGATAFSQIKDPVARRAAILEAVNASRVQRSPDLSFDDPLSGGLVRRR